MANFGVLNLGTGQTPNATTVTNSSTVIVAANTSRRFVSLVNVGRNDVWLAFDTTALVGKGWFIGRNGGSLIITSESLSVGALNGITDSGTSSVAFQDFNIPT